MLIDKETLGRFGFNAEEKAMLEHTNPEDYVYPFRVKANSKYLYVEKHRKFLGIRFWFMVRSYEIESH